MARPGFWIRGCSMKTAEPAWAGQKPQAEFELDIIVQRFDQYFHDVSALMLIVFFDERVVELMFIGQGQELLAE